MRSLFTALGLKAKEQKAFLTLLELGAQPVSTLAHQLSLPRSSTYLILERLRALGLVEEFKRSNMKYVKCISVHSIGNLIHSQQKELEQTERLFEEALPKLSALENRLSITPTVKHHEGKRAVMNLYEEVLNGQSFDAIFNPEMVKTHMPEYHYLIPKTAEKENVRLRELLVAGREAKSYQKKFAGPRHEIKILPKDAHFEADIIITQNEIYMIAYGDREVSAMEIRNPVLAEAQRALFEGWWGSLNQ